MTLFLVAQFVLAPFIFWLFVLFLVGLLPTRPEKGTCEKKLRFAILCCARNEERVIANLIRSLKEQDYPEENRQIFVIAHHCTDGTAAAAQAAGAIVWELVQADKRCKGDALRYGISRILAERRDDFDAFCVFDADNTAEPDFLEIMNDQLQQPHVDGAIGMRKSVNPHESFVSEMLAVHWFVMSRMYHLPRVRLGLSCVIQGTGFCVKATCLDPDGWQTSALTEDFEFTVRKVLTGHRFVHVPDAVFYDEQPVEWNTWLSQMYRWMFGAKQCTGLIPSILCRLFVSPLRCWDLLWNTCLVGVCALSALATTIALTMALISACENGTRMVIGVVVIMVAALTFVLLMAALSTRMCGGRLRRYARGILCYPLFTMSGPLLFLLALTRRHCVWRSVLHKGKS
ncbi:MAG: glycosyltransferase family 2 protein [Planctomycetia bacterium]|nr:glycosyltransferase family 2 protein [Planctomycetia bacterium]